MADGPGRLLVALYCLFALAAAVQLAGEVTLPYALSALAAAVYLVAAIAWVRGARRVAIVACTIELAGVLVVGSLLSDDSVWSAYGSGYGYVPLVLPVLGLVWLSRS